MQAVGRTSGRNAGLLGGREATRRAKAIAAKLYPGMPFRGLFISAKHCRLLDMVSALLGVFVQHGYTTAKEKQFRVGRWSYSADGWIEPLRLVIEIDGAEHRDRREFDRKRDKTLRELHSVNVVRFDADVPATAIAAKIVEQIGSRNLAPA